MRFPDANKSEAAPHIAGATREALIAAATTVFAERGFQDATIREICQLAGANVAAVNYHFGGKEDLYSEVVVAVKHTGAPPVHLQMGAEVPAAVRLEAHIRWLLGRLVCMGPVDPLGQIMGREMIQPTPALDRLIEEFFRPQSVWLEVVVRELIGPGLGDEVYARGVMSVISQVVFYKHCRPVLERMGPGYFPTAATFEAQVRHIVDFSLAGFHGMRLAAAANGPKPGAEGSDCPSRNH